MRNDLRYAAFVRLPEMEKRWDFSIFNSILAPPLITNVFRLLMTRYGN